MPQLKVEAVSHLIKTINNMNIYYSVEVQSNRTGVSKERLEKIEEILNSSVFDTEEHAVEHMQHLYTKENIPYMAFLVKKTYFL